MRHRKSGRQLNRNSSHRKAMFRNMTCSLVEHELIRTTLPKAKELRPIVEKLITLAKRGDLAARRRVVSQLPNEPLVVNKLFDVIAPKYADRQSGFTRLVHIGQRRGDAAEIVQIELV